MKKNVFCKTSYGKKDKGATMVIAIIIMGILIIFAFALLLVAYTLYASQNKNLASIRCSEAANSLSAAIDKDLTSDNPEKYSHLYKYIRYNICQTPDTYWPYYVDDSTPGHDKDSAFRYFDMTVNYKKESVANTDGIDGLPGTTKVCIYWMLPKDRDTAVNPVSNNMYSEDKNDVRLYIEVTCESANQSYTVKKAYKLTEYKYSTTEADDISRYKRIKNGSSYVTDKDNPLGKTLYTFESETDPTLNEPEKKWRWESIDVD